MFRLGLTPVLTPPGPKCVPEPGPGHVRPGFRRPVPEHVGQQLRLGQGPVPPRLFSGGIRLGGERGQRRL